MRDLFTALPDDPAPPLADGYLDRVLVRGRRSVRRRRIGTAAAWTAVVLAFAALLVPVVPQAERPAAPARHPSVPDHFAGYSTLTSTVERSAPGRAIAMYTYGNGELFNMFQPLVVGADKDTYRRVGAVEERGKPQSLLSPDGTRVLVGERRGETTDLLLVDLTTGDRRSIDLGASFEVRLLAWSPDGRYVALGAAVTDPSQGQPDSAEYDALRHGTLRLLDLSTGRSTAVPSVRSPFAAAFAPDGARVAVQSAQEVHLLDLLGTEQAVVPVGAGRGLVARAGWSADGRFLATVPWDGTAVEDGTFLTENAQVTFVPIAAGTPTPAPVADVVRLLGWRDPDHVIAATTDAQGHMSLHELTLSSGDRRVLSRFDTGMTCEFHLQHCEVADLQLATGLLADLGTRPAESTDHGPWPWALRALAALPLAGLVLLYFLLRRRRS
nr:hypothetical protein GCM10020063_085440 [Dactylosporangium thailandense]